MIVSGDLLGGIPFVRRNFEKVVLAIIAVSVLPVVVQLWNSRKPQSEVKTAAAD